MPISFINKSSSLVEENTTDVVLDIEASLNSGPVDFGLVYSITDGADQTVFKIDSTSGELRFLTSPDYETPSDHDFDNVFNLIVTVTAISNQETNTQALEITVTDDLVETVIGYQASYELSNLDGSNGFIIHGINRRDESARSVSSAGDVNGDGYDDIIIGAHWADQTSRINNNTGESYVVFGQSNNAHPVLELSGLDGSNGFIINGVGAQDRSGFAVSSAGDVNGDGLSDLIIGARNASPNNQKSGESYVVFGKETNLAPTVNLSSLDSSQGFVIKGIDAFDYSGYSVSDAGDINGDGFGDVIIGAHFADPNGQMAGESYVVFGFSDDTLFSIELSSLDGSNGFKINGINAGDMSGYSVSTIGDVNGDGYSDIIIGAPYANRENNVNTGESYVVFGASGHFNAAINLSSLDGHNGFVIKGTDRYDYSGISVSNAGDVNGDTFDDLIIGAFLANDNAGQTYVLYGSHSFGSTIELTGLDGTNGFVINGSRAGDNSGISASSAGDVNGDGFGDLIIGAYSADPNGGKDAGETYVVFGGDDLTPTIDLSNLNGIDGFKLNGVDAGDWSGFSVSGAGDVNGDGYDDLLIGAYKADPNGNNNAGESYLVFGGPNLLPQPSEITFDNASSISVQENIIDVILDIDARLNGGINDEGLNYSITGGEDQSLFTIHSSSGELRFITAPDYENPLDKDEDNHYYLTISATSESDTASNTQTLEVFVTNQLGEPIFGYQKSYELSSLDGSNGFILNGIAERDYSGWSLSNAGDINGDGYDDIIIGAYRANPNGIRNAGESYVVFGGSDGFSPSIELSNLNGDNGFKLSGIDADDYSGWSVSDAGDINRDGYGDIAIGAFKADLNGENNIGESYVIYGKGSPFDHTMELSSLDGSDGFKLNGINRGDRSGFSISSAGDINGDGYDDLLLGARGADPNNNGNAGESYLVFGSNSRLNAVLELSSLDGANGFKLNGVDSGDRSGYSLSSAGDINGDGYSDIIIGAFRADTLNNDAGESYVVFGASSGFVSVIELSSLDGNDGFKLNGIADGDQSGYAVSNAGDVNGDGYGDLLIGAWHANPNGQNNAGESYVVFGASTRFDAAIDLANLDGSNGFSLKGIDADDYSGISVASAGDINGDGYDDMIIGASGSDQNNTINTGESYVVFGFNRDLVSISAIELSSLDGSNGFKLSGIREGDKSGTSVAGGGDINGDGYADLIIGASEAEPNGLESAGETYVIFGGPFLASQLSGTNGADTLVGTMLNDRLVGGEGDDVLTGGLGADTFVFANNGGHDTVTDFNTSEDILDLSLVSTGFNSFEDMATALSETIQNGRAGVLINLNDSQSIFIEAASLSDLTVNNILF